MGAAVWSLWWVWGAAALVLAILEVMVPGFVFLGFAVGALAVTLLLLNTGMALGLPLLLLIFAALSLMAWLALRRIFAGPGGQVRTFRDDIND
jgi:membrane protein implicated in regulation of membrane protease activity